MCKKNDRYFYTLRTTCWKVFKKHKKSCKIKKLLQKRATFATLQKRAVLKSNLNGRFFYTLLTKYLLKREEINIILEERKMKNKQSKGLSLSLQILNIWLEAYFSPLQKFLQIFAKKSVKETTPYWTSLRT